MNKSDTDTVAIKIGDISKNVTIGSECNTIGRIERAQWIGDISSSRISFNVDNRYFIACACYIYRGIIGGNVRCSRSR